MTTQLLTYDDLAAILQVSRRTLLNGFSKDPDRYPPRIYIGPRQIRFHPETVEKWLAAKDAKGRRLFK